MVVVLPFSCMPRRAACSSRSSRSPPARRSNSSYAATLKPPLGARSAHDFALPSFARKNLLLFLSLSRSPALWSSPPPFGAQLYLSTNTQDKYSSSGRQANRNKCFFFFPPSGFVPFVSSLLCCVDTKKQGSNKEGGSRIEDRKRNKAEEEENWLLKRIQGFLGDCGGRVGFGC